MRLGNVSSAPFHRLRISPIELEDLVTTSMILASAPTVPMIVIGSIFQQAGKAARPCDVFPHSEQLCGSNEYSKNKRGRVVRCERRENDSDAGPTACSMAQPPATKKESAFHASSFSSPGTPAPLLIRSLSVIPNQRSKAHRSIIVRYRSLCMYSNRSQSFQFLYHGPDMYQTQQRVYIRRHEYKYSCR